MKNTNVGIFGKGYWGTILNKNLLKISDVKFIADSKTSNKYQIKELDWCIVATPDKTHYKLVKKILKKKINVFCEKPLSRSFDECKKLYQLAKKNDAKLYVSEVELFRNLKFKKNFKKIKIFRGKKTNSTHSDLLYKLMYHDLYIVYDLIKYLKIKSISCEKKRDSLKVFINFTKQAIVFSYDRNLKRKVHSINNKILSKKKNLVLKMLKDLFSSKIKFNENKERSLFCVKMLNQVEKILNEK
jgi:hypothetical protein